MTTSYTGIQRLLEQRISNPLFNTSYPLSPDDWAQFSTPGKLPFNSLKPIALYLHIPFCRQICSFCEYTKMCVPSIDTQQKYLNALRFEIEQFTAEHPQLKVYGFDIGGGTPTSLDYGLFAEFMNQVGKLISELQTTSDFEPSIEGSFETLVNVSSR